MEELRMIIAGNIGKLRREAGLTQLELAEQLNYSDKAISKWERGDSIPDVVTLKKVADLFSVTVDYLLRADHPAEMAAKREYTKTQKRNRFLISAISCVLVWLVATFIYANVNWATHYQLWQVFVGAVPITLVVALVFNSIWGNRRYNFLIISLLVWTLIVTIYVATLELNLWLVFLLGIPAQVIILLWSGIRTRKKTK